MAGAVAAFPRVIHSYPSSPSQFRGSLLCTLPASLVARRGWPGGQVLTYEMQTESIGTPNEVLAKRFFLPWMPK